VNEPPTVLCSEEPFAYDHSALDKDGDSLVYELCDAFSFPTGIIWNGGPAGAAPNPSMYPDLLDTVPYISGYSGSYPIDALSSDSFQIDMQTGLLTGTPMIYGVYVVAVCVSDYRNGKRLSQSRRDFAFSIVECVLYSQVWFNSSSSSICKEDSIQFTDMTPNAVSWSWDFGDGNISTEQNPFHKYMTSGTYDVTLDIEYANGCLDSATITNLIFVDTCTVVSTDQILSTGFNDVKLIPNPVMDDVEISLPEGVSAPINVTLYYLDGREIKNIVTNSGQSDRPTKVKLSHLAKGVYLMEIEWEDGLIITKRLVKM